ncbi:hypothetical protein V8E36_006864 [Tilletia maclaganii]
MQLHSKAVLIAFFFAAVRVHAYDWEHHHNCVEEADAHCRGTGYEDTLPWQIEYARCMSDYWRSLPTDGNCPHRGIGCHCYQGCVQDSYTDYQDVGGYCVKACTQANMPSEFCGSLPP